MPVRQSLTLQASKLRPFVPSLASRCIHSTPADRAALSTPTPTSLSEPETPPALQYYPPSAPKVAAALSCLPLSQILRTYLITSISSSPTLLSASSSILTRMLNSTSILTSVERNPILRLLLRETFYKQFCAGSDQAEIQRCMSQMKDTGFSGIILEYALEVLQDAKNADEARDVEVWRKGMLASVSMVNTGDFVGLKWSGMGADAMRLMKANQAPSSFMDKAMREVCDAATAKGVRLLPSAEETNTLAAYHSWTLNMQRRYNTATNGMVIYNTYQAYLRSCAETVTEHLNDAKKHGYTLGVKLVRGAYLGSEPQGTIFGSKEDSDASYDWIASSLIKQEYTGVSEDFPQVDVVLATHNAVSVRKAQALRTQQLLAKEKTIPLVYAQLQGMADEVSCELIQAGKANGVDGHVVDVPKAFKLTTWGSMTQCLNYLLRRAAENKDAAGRTMESKAAMAGELRRRFKLLFGSA